MTNYINTAEQEAQLKRHIDLNNPSITDENAKDVVMHHLASFLDSDIEALMTDYSDDSVLITQAATYSGLKEIRAFFVGLNIHFSNKEFQFELDKVVATNNLVYIVWHAKSPSLQVPLGSDTFVLKEGKIFQQTFVGQLNFMSE